MRRASAVAAVVIVIIVVRASIGTSWPALTTSCTTPAFALSDSSVAQHHPLRYTVTGPADVRYAIGIGVGSYAPQPDHSIRVVPDPGVPVRSTLTSNPRPVGSGCVSHGSFGMVIPPGHYTVRLFTLNGTGPDPLFLEVAQRPLTVTG